MTDEAPVHALPEDLQRIADQALVDKAVADAKKAELDNARAEAANAEAAEAAAIAARKADAEARKSEAEADDYDSPEARIQRQADAVKAAAEAERDAAAARRAQVSALIPDFGSVKESTLASNDGPAVAGTMLMFGAMRSIGEDIAGAIVTNANMRATILLTSDPDLATGDAVYTDVVSGLDELQGAADRMLATDYKIQIEDALGAGPLDVAAAVASAIPGLLSLFTAQRTLATASIAPSDLAACAAVAGELATLTSLTVIHDDFRTVPEGVVYAKSAGVSDARRSLAALKIQLTREKVTLDDTIAAAKQDVAAREAALKKAAHGDVERLKQELEGVRAALLKRQGDAAVLALRLALIESLMGAIDQFLATARTIAPGAKRSPLATAALHEQLRGAEASGSTASSSTASGHETTSSHDTRFTHVLLVKAQPGQSQQLLDNRPLWFEDKFSTLVDVSATYMLIELPSSRIVKAGTVTKVGRAYGALGAEPKLLFKDPDGL
jgi:hypothetical protein